MHRLRRLKPSIGKTTLDRASLSGVVVFARSLINKKSCSRNGCRIFWSCYPDSDRGPHPYQGCALPTELPGHDRSSFARRLPPERALLYRKSVRLSSMNLRKTQKSLKEPFKARSALFRTRTAETIYKRKTPRNLSTSGHLSWSCYPDSNWRPHPYQGCALPTEL